MEPIHKHRIYVTSKDFFDIMFPNLFTPYISDISRTSHPNGLIESSEDLKLWGSDKYFGYWAVQLGFAIYCASTCLGISADHLHRGSGMLKAVYRFHVYYHVRRILQY